MIHTAECIGSSPPVSYTHLDVYKRQGVLTLDFVSQAKLNKHLSFNLKARNLLNPSYKLSRKANENGEKVILNDYKKGINISLGVSCTF